MKQILQDKKVRKYLTRWLPVLAVLLLITIPSDTAAAEEASAVKIGTINYETLTMQIYSNGNDIVYYSTDNATWEELEAVYNSSAGAYSMDIAWVSLTSDYTLYFKGDEVSTVKSVTLPSQNSEIDVTYDKAEGEFTFSNVEEADYFEWRKSSDYYWNTVSLTESSSSYKSFLSAMESFRTKGAKIILRTPQEIGTSASNTGARPSKEVTVSITARGAAPAVKVNSSKLSMNTTKAMEYYDSKTDLWIEFDGTSYIEDIAPKALYENGASGVTLQIRKSATSSAPSSKVQKLTIPAQTAAPAIGGSSAEVTYYYQNSKLMLQFNQATTTNAYQYAIIRQGNIFSASSASWKAVTSSKLMTLSASAAPDGCKIYVRRRGTDENTTKSISLALPSAAGSFTVDY